ncbi:uncharacterized protein LOC142337714 isoform X2 [Convolutriloba macropyga]|uniref:uncharacterized protein LOC142337714 isoform X2 n=1 Tax=Convolutriloba macropyga TaxID=536237 RepID=UPI003F525402
MPGRVYEFTLCVYCDNSDVTTDNNHQSNSPTSSSGYKEVTFSPLLCRTPDPISPPILCIQSYTSSQICVTWDKPWLVSPVTHAQHELLGYTVRVNGNVFTQLPSSAQTCFLTKCRPGKMYSACVTAITKVNPSSAKKKTRFATDSISEAEKLLLESEDESTSESVSIILPEKRVGNIHKVSCNYIHDIAFGPNHLGFLKLEWSHFHAQDKKTPESLGIVAYEVAWREDLPDVTSVNERESEAVTNENVSTSGRLSRISRSDSAVGGRDKAVERRVKIERDESGFMIPITLQGAVIEAHVVCITRTCSSSSEKVSFRVPAPPDPPDVTLKTVTSTSIVIEWTEPRCYGSNSIAGYQVYLDGKRAGNVLNKSCFKALIPYKPNRKYEVQVVALSSNSEFRDSDFSDVILVSTYPTNSDVVDTTQTTNQSDRSFRDESRSDVTPARSSNRSRAGSSALTERGVTNIELTVVSITDCSISVELRLLEKGVKVTDYTVEWNSISGQHMQTPESIGTLKLRAPATQTAAQSSAPIPPTQFTLDGLRSGTNHFIRVTGANKSGVIVAKSKQLTVLTATPLGPPVTRLASSDLSQIVIEWTEPVVCGDALIAGYKVFVNSKFVAQLDPEQLTFEFRKGLMCREYSFQVQALSSLENLDSDLSKPVVAVWPGVVAPQLQCLPTTRQNAIRVGWHSPFVAGNVKLLNYTVSCERLAPDGSGNAVVNESPKFLTLEPEACEAEFTGLPSDTIHRVTLQIRALGLEEILQSEPIETKPSLLPDAPLINVQIRNAEERKQLDEQACILFNKRDKFLRMIHFVQKMAINGKFLTSKSEEIELIRLGSTLAQIDSQLTETVSRIAKLTGRVEVMLSWEGGSDVQVFSPRSKNRRASSNPGKGASDVKSEQTMEVSGYKVFLNGRQYGLTVNSDVKNMVLRMNVDRPLHKISLLALSGESNSIVNNNNNNNNNNKNYNSSLNRFLPGHPTPAPNNQTSHHVTSYGYPVNHATCSESNIVLVPTDTFRPLSLFCFIKAHLKNTRWPQTGCCVLTDSLPYEKHQLPQTSSSMMLGGHSASGSPGLATSGTATGGRLISPGCLRRITPCPSVDVFNVITREWQSLYPIGGTEDTRYRYTLIMFWTSWCASSQNLMKYFLGHARDNQHLNFITCCIGSGESTHDHYSDIYEVLATYPDSFADNITHTCGCLRVGGLNSAHDQRPFKRRPQSSRSSLRSSSFNQNNAYYSSPAELFGVQGVPMLFILTENGLISWQARFAACRQEDLDLFLKEAIQELDRNEASLQLGKVGQGGNSTNSNNQNTINQSNILPYGANRGVKAFHLPKLRTGVGI